MKPSLKPILTPMMLLIALTTCISAIANSPKIRPANISGSYECTDSEGGVHTLSVEAYSTDKNRFSARLTFGSGGDSSLTDFIFPSIYHTQGDMKSDDDEGSTIGYVKVKTADSLILMFDGETDGVNCIK